MVTRLDDHMNVDKGKLKCFGKHFDQTVSDCRVCPCSRDCEQSFRFSQSPRPENEDFVRGQDTSESYSVKSQSKIPVEGTSPFAGETPDSEESLESDVETGGESLEELYKINPGTQAAHVLDVLREGWYTRSDLKDELISKFGGSGSAANSTLNKLVADNRVSSKLVGAKKKIYHID